MQSNAAARSALRDTVKRLNKIRKECGVDDDAAKGIQRTGDPFRDACNAFTATLRECSDQVDDRNISAKKYGQDDRNVIEQSNSIALQMRELEKHMGTIRDLVSQADGELARAHMKKKSANKILLLERQFTERNNTYSQCENLLNALKEKNGRRFDTNGLTQPQKVRLGAKNAMREQLLALKRNTAPMGSGVNEEGDTEMIQPNSMRGTLRAKRLEEDPATKEQMRQIAADDRKISQGLDNIMKGVSRLHEIALQIGSEIDNQNKMLDATEEKVDKSHNKLTKLNDRLGAMVKKSRPMNIFINIGCCIVLLGLVGFLLYQFDVI